MISAQDCQLPDGQFSPYLATNRESMSPQKILEGFSNIFHLGSFAPKSLKIEGVKQLPYLDQPTAPGDALQKDSQNSLMMMVMTMPSCQVAAVPQTKPTALECESSY